MYFITGMGKTQCGNKSSISGFEANVRGDPGDSVVGAKMTCGIELVNGSSIIVAMKKQTGQQAPMTQ